MQHDMCVVFDDVEVELMQSLMANSPNDRSPHRNRNQRADMIGSIAPYVSKFRRSYQSNDVIDRLNYQYTALVIAFAAFTLAATQYVGKPIQCWVPAQFTGAWEKYTETYCFIKGSYFQYMDEHIPHEYELRDQKEIQYYQWVPIVLAIQAFLFYLPCIIWKALSFRSGINVKGVLNSAAQVKKKFDKASRSTQVQIAANHLEEAMEMQKEIKTGTFDVLHFGKRRGLYLVALYLCSKIDVALAQKYVYLLSIFLRAAVTIHLVSFLYIINTFPFQFLYVLNAAVQLLILNIFLGPEYTLWGYGILKDLLNNRTWNESGHFPRVTMCDFHVRVLGNIHRWTVQCVLMINMFNEKIFIFLWSERWWLIFVGILSILSMLYYLFALLIKSNQRYFVERYLRCTGAISSIPGFREDRQLTEFTDRYLRPDGVFLLRLIETNGGDLLVGDITAALFERYLAKGENSLGTLPATESPASTSPLQR
uniref:Innexin n=1 Tax=Syphacia muris TaxID=451379 RepID=A0A0N5AIV2_9BILA